MATQLVLTRVFNLTTVIMPQLAFIGITTDFLFQSNSQFIIKETALITWPFPALKMLGIATFTLRENPNLTTVNLGQLTELFLIDQTSASNFISFRQNPSLQSVIVGNVTVSTCFSSVGECTIGMPATTAQGFATCYIDPAMVPLSPRGTSPCKSPPSSSMAHSATL